MYLGSGLPESSGSAPGQEPAQLGVLALQGEEETCLGAGKPLACLPLVTDETGLETEVT